MLTFCIRIGANVPATALYQFTCLCLFHFLRSLAGKVFTFCAIAVLAPHLVHWYACQLMAVDSPIFEYHVCNAAFIVLVLAAMSKFAGVPFFYAS